MDIATIIAAMKQMGILNDAKKAVELNDFSGIAGCINVALSRNISTKVSFGTIGLVMDELLKPVENEMASDPEAAVRYIAERREDAVALLLRLIEVSDLGYARLAKTSTGWQVVTREGVVIPCNSKRCAVAIILKKWW